MSKTFQEISAKPRQTAEDVDAMVGRNIQKYRLKKRWTQHNLAAQLGLSYQQIQKFENATNRISAGRLFQVAKALEVSILDLFIEKAGKKPAMKDLRNLSPAAIKLAQGYDKVATPKLQKALSTIMLELSDS